MSSKEELLAKLAKAGTGADTILRDAPKALRGDRECVLVALAGWHGALQYASEELQTDREMLLAAEAQRAGTTTYLHRNAGANFSIEMDGLHGQRKPVPLVTEDVRIDLQKVLEAPVFLDWVAAVDADPQLFIEEIEVQSVDMFGPRIGFIKFKSRAMLSLGGDEGVVEVPGIVFMRGGAVGVLVILECEGEEHTILTYQARVPVGTANLPEIPAGMLDGSGNFKGVAADEIAEECDLIITEEELVDLTELAYAGKWKGMLPSAGGCDEFIRLYMFRREVERDVLTELEGRLTGLREEGERIKLHIVPLKDCWRQTPDAKALSCITLYEKLVAEGKLPGVVRTVETRLQVNRSTSIDDEAVAEPEAAADATSATDFVRQPPTAAAAEPSAGGGTRRHKKRLAGSRISTGDGSKTKVEDMEAKLRNLQARVCVPSADPIAAPKLRRHLLGVVLRAEMESEKEEMAAQAEQAEHLLATQASELARRDEVHARELAAQGERLQRQQVWKGVGAMAGMLQSKAIQLAREAEQSEPSGSEPEPEPEVQVAWSALADAFGFEARGELEQTRATLQRKERELAEKETELGRLRAQLALPEGVPPQ